MLLKSLRLGSNDLARSRAFYDATFSALGVSPCSTPDQYPIVMWDLGGVKFLLGPARNGELCTYANGGTIIFEAESDEAAQTDNDGTDSDGFDTTGASESAGTASGGDSDGN